MRNDWIQAAGGIERDGRVADANGDEGNRRNGRRPTTKITEARGRQADPAGTPDVEEQGASGG